MSTPIRRIDPADIPRSGAVEEYSPRLVGAAEWELVIDDPPLEPESRGRHLADRRACLVVAVMGALIGFGFVGGHSAQDAGSASAIALDAPVGGATIEGATVAFRGTVARGPGAVDVTVVLGGVILGRTTVTVAMPGPISGSVRVFAPPTTVRVQVVATFVEPGTPAAVATAPTSGSAVTVREVTLKPAGPVGLWPVGVVRANGRTVLIVAGCAPLSVRRVDTEVTTHGRRVATIAAAVGPTGGPDGSIGAASLGLGSFTARLLLPDPVPVGRLDIDVAWRDDLSGMWGDTWASATASVGSR